MVGFRSAGVEQRGLPNVSDLSPFKDSGGQRTKLIWDVMDSIRRGGPLSGEFHHDNRDPSEPTGSPFRSGLGYDRSMDMNVKMAVQALHDGGLVAIPTETVYGLGADGTNPEALRSLFRIKGRPLGHPIILHLGKAEWLEEFALGNEWSRKLSQVFWPGPLTMILPRTDRVPPEACGGQATVGLRVPAHPLALELLLAFGKPIAAPSANRFGRISPTTADHVLSEFGDSIAGILDGGPCSVGLESTVLDLSQERPVILRPGGVSASQIESVLGTGMGAPGSTKAPGTLKSHYAPTTPCRLCRGVEIAKRCGGQAVLSMREDPECGAAFWLQASSDPQSYGHELYANLRRLDSLKAEGILVEEVPSGEAWAAVRDRLEKACYETTGEN